jgi:hypothetical protein
MSRPSSRRTLRIAALVIAFGWFALATQAQTTCRQGCLINNNTVLGSDALLNNTGKANTATGSAALRANQFGAANTATGARALENNQTGGQNTACGHGALAKNTTGNDNIGLGYGAGVALTTGSHNIDIGNAGVGGESGAIRIGDSDSTTAFIAGIRGVAVSGSPVVIGEGGQLGVAASSRQFKDDIQPMEKASEAILGLTPVTFRYKPKIDPKGIPQFGLVAEEVEKVNPDLVARDEQGKPYTVRYEAVNAMLLNEFLKEHRAFVAEEHKVQTLEANAARQQRQIEALTAGLQNVSAQIELSKSRPQTVAGNQ